MFAPLSAYPPPAADSFAFALSAASVLKLLVYLALGTAAVVALCQWRRLPVLFAGLGVVAGSAFVALVLALWFGPASTMLHPMLGWAIMAVPVLSSLCYVTITLAPSRARAKQFFLLTTYLLVAALIVLDSRFHVKFTDKDGHPIAGGIVEILFMSSYSDYPHPEYPVSGDDGIAYVGLMRAASANSIYVHGHGRGRG